MYQNNGVHIIKSHKAITNTQNLTWKNSKGKKSQKKWG